MNIQAGDRYSRNGITVIVHSIEAGEVYFEKRPSHNIDKEWPQDDDFWPLHRMSVEQFTREAK